MTDLKYTRRELAALKIDLTEILPLPEGWSVPSESGQGHYLVCLNDEDRRSCGDEEPWARFPDCTCSDYRFRHARCKHIAAVFFKLASYEITMGEAVQEFERISQAAQEWSP